MEQQAKFEGWAIVELMGHQREVGFVTTQYFGGAALFQVDVPEMAEREYELEQPQYVEVDGYSRWVDKGSKVKRREVPARTRLVSPSAVYALNPCTEETAKKAIERNSPRGLILLDVKEDKPALTAGEESSRKPCGCDPGECCEECEPVEGWNGDGR